MSSARANCVGTYGRSASSRSSSTAAISRCSSGRSQRAAHATHFSKTSSPMAPSSNDALTPRCGCGCGRDVATQPGSASFQRHGLAWRDDDQTSGTCCAREPVIVGDEGCQHLAEQNS